MIFKPTLNTDTTAADKLTEPQISECRKRYREIISTLLQQKITPNDVLIKEIKLAIKNAVLKEAEIFKF